MPLNVPVMEVIRSLRSLRARMGENPWSPRSPRRDRGPQFRVGLFGPRSLLGYLRLFRRQGPGELSSWWLSTLRLLLVIKQG